MYTHDLFINSSVDIIFRRSYYTKRSLIERSNIKIYIIKPFFFFLIEYKNIVFSSSPTSSTPSRRIVPCVGRWLVIVIGSHHQRSTSHHHLFIFCYACNLKHIYYELQKKEKLKLLTNKNENTLE